MTRCLARTPPGRSAGSRRLYGPAVRWAPWAWGAGYYVSNSRLAMALLSRTAFAPATRTVAALVSVSQPISSCPATR